MSSELLIGNGKQAVVQLTNGQHWLRLAVWLSNEFRGGELVRAGRGATVSVEACDTLSSSYDRANWISGVTSGALYAFRTLRIARQRVVLAELAGRLAAADMDMVAGAAAIAISMLANKPLNLPTEGWSRQVSFVERPPPESMGENEHGEPPH